MDDVAGRAGFVFYDRKRLTETGLFLLAFLATVAITVAVTRFASNIAALWPANGILCAALFRIVPKHRLPLLVLASIGNGLINVAAGQATALAFGLASLNALEAFIAWKLIDRFCRHIFRFDDVRLLWRFAAIAALAAPLVPSLLAATILTLESGKDFWTSYRIWHVADGLGLTLVVPAVKLWLNRHSHPGFSAPRSVVVLSLVGLLLLECFVFMQSEYPALFLTIPAMIFIAFRLGPVWTSFATLLMSVVAFAFTVRLSGPATLIHGAGLTEQVQFVQFFITIVFLTSLPVAYALAEQAHLRNKLSESSEETRLAKERAEKALQVKSEFLATMSHEIRTPLNSIVGYTRLALEQDRLPSEAQRHLAIVCDASRSLQKIVNDILDVSSIEAGQLKLVPEPECLANILGQCSELIEVLAAEKGLRTSFTCARDLQQTVISVDSQRLKQVLLNLLGNAVKYTDEGSVGCRVLKISENRDFCLVRFVVWDTGPGIPDDAQQNLFKRFTQLDASRQRRHGGTGLGLAISAQLVAQMGGVIEVQSKVGEGTRFSFALTFAKRSRPTPAAERVGAPGDGLARSIRVLVVDDIEATRRLTEAVLRKAGWETVGASGGEEALHILSNQHHFDVVLMDVQMPHVDGLTVTRILRERGGANASVPIIAMTANVLAEEIDKCMSAGMDAHIGKPFDWTSLIDLVRKHARSRSLTPSD